VVNCPSDRFRVSDVDLLIGEQQLQVAQNEFVAFATGAQAVTARPVPPGQILTILAGIKENLNSPVEGVTDFN